MADDRDAARGNQPTGEPVQFPWAHGWDWIKRGTEMFLATPGMWVLLVIIQLLIGLGISVIPTPDGPAGWLLDSLLQVVGLVVGVLLDAGLLLGCDAVRRGQPLRVVTLFAAFGHPATAELIKLALIQVLVWLALGALALVLAVLLIVGQASLSGIGASGIADVVLRSFGSAMIIVLVVMTFALLFVMALWMATPLIVFRGYTPLRALTESFNANLGNVRALTIYGLGMVGLALLATLPLLLGFLVWLPLATTTRYAAFLDLFEAPPDAPRGVRAL